MNFVRGRQQINRFIFRITKLQKKGKIQQIINFLFHYSKNQPKNNLSLLNKECIHQNPYFIIFHRYMIKIQSQLILKRTLYQQNGQQTVKSYRILRCRLKTQSIQIYDVYDSQLSQEFTLKIMLKNQSLSKQSAINQIKNQQLFIGRHNFINLFQIYQDNLNIYLIMQKWGTSLIDLVNERQCLSQYEAQLIFSQIVDMIVQLRKKNIAHNFITLESLYVDIKEKHKLKLGDFKKSFNISGYFASISGNSQDDYNYNNRQSSQKSLQKTQKKSKGHAFSGVNIRQTSAINNQKPSCYYSSPQELQKQNFSNNNANYNRLLGNLYESDIWNLGIILYRVLLARFPFDNQNQTGPSAPMQFGFQVFANKGELEEINKKQCCYSFYQRSSIYCEPVSSQFKQLIKSILKPALKRIKLKDLINHPLKLNSYYNLRDLSFQHDLPPLLTSTLLPLYNPLKPIKTRMLENYLIQKQIQAIQQKRKKGKINYSLFNNGNDNGISELYKKTQGRRKLSYDDYLQFSKGQFSYQNYDEDKGQNQIQSNFRQSDQVQLSLKYLSPEINYPVFSVFGDDPIDLSHNRVPQKYNKQKYFYTWDLNFSSQLSEIGTQSLLDEAISRQQTQHQLFFNEKQGYLNNAIYDRKPMINPNKTTSRQTNVMEWYELNDKQEQYQDQDKNNYDQKMWNERENSMKKTMKTLKKHQQNDIVPKKQMFKSVHNQAASNPTQGLLNKNSSSSQFNIRNINTRKNINSTIFSQPDKIVNKQALKNQQGINQNSATQSNFHHHHHYSKTLQSSRHFATKSNLVTQNAQEQFKSKNKNNFANRGYPMATDQIHDSHIKIRRSKYKQLPSDNPLNSQLSNNTNYQSQMLILKNHISEFPLMVEQPEFVLQYKYLKQDNSLGYVLNNGVGVIYPNGKHVIGHNQNDYVVVSYKNCQSQKDVNIKVVSYQPHKFSKYNSAIKNLSSSEMLVYQYFLRNFGKRMVVSNFSIWIERFWRNGRVFIFLFNNGSWQVALQSKKTSKFFIIDQNQLIWTKGKIHPDMMNQIREIVNQKRQEIIQEQYFFK